MKNIAIIGTGNVGSVLGKRLADVGYEVTFGSRNPAAPKVVKLIADNPHAHRAATVQEAVDAAEVILLATPYDYLESTVETMGDAGGKIVIDCSNPLTASFDGLQLGFDHSAAERVAELLPGAHVIKAFNTASVATMADPEYDGQQATMFYCGDDSDAKRKVGQIIQDLGLEPVDSGPLLNARYLEPMAMLYIHLAVKEGWGGHCALKMLRRERPDLDD